VGDVSDALQIGSKKYNLKSVYVLRALIESLEKSSLARASALKVTWDPYPLKPEKGSKLTQDYLWTVSRFCMKDATLLQC
jgi:hypothetical protein